jgi:hypothetical protein
MEITITTTAAKEDAHLTCYLLDSNDIIILNLKDNDYGSIGLISNERYRFEWHVWGSGNSKYSISANVTPENTGFPPLKWEKEYSGPHEDMGGFYFNI